MSAFTSAQLPTGARDIDNVEELVLWGAYILQRYNASKTFLRVAGQPNEPVVSISDFPDGDGVLRRQVVVMYSVNQDRFLENVPSWKEVNEMSATAIAAGFSG